MDRQERLQRLGAWAQDERIKDLARKLGIALYPRHSVLADYPIDNKQAFLFWCWQIEKIPLTDEQRRRLRGLPEFERANMFPSEADVRVLLEMAKAAGPMMDEEIRRWFEGLEGGQARAA